MSTATTHIKTEKQLVPAMRFNEFSEPINETRFSEVVESNIYGPRFNANDYSEVGNVRTIRGTDLGIDGEIKYEQVPLALLDEKTVNTHKLQEGDIVMITTAECGATGVFRKQSIDYLSSAYGVRIRLNNLGYPYYFKYFFQTRLAKKEINSYIRKSTIANLPGSDILRIKLYKPTLPEQQKIASFLAAVDEKIQQLTKKKALLEDYKKGVMQQLFSCQLRFKDENGKAYPDWEEKRLGEITKYTKGFAFKSADYQDSGVRIVRVSDLLTTSIKKDNEKVFLSSEKASDYSKYQLIEGNIIVTTVGSKPEMIESAVGRGIYINNNNEGLLNQNMLKFENIEGVSNRFVIGLINSKRYQHYMKGIARGNANQANITVVDLLKYKVPLPSLPEQQKIATYLSRIDTKTEAVNNQITQTQTFKKG
ncbi:MAG: restriction endonuclease subunit S, partial [Flavobacteriales bacterium]